MKIRFCPKCKNTDIMLEAGGITGTMRCKECSYRGVLFPEREVNIKQNKKKKGKK
jgi:DNA-directed RNA polymerase subunit M/transcription elongation factor TFIIS